MCPLRLLLTCRIHGASGIVWQHTDPLRFESLTPTQQIRRFQLCGRSGRLACDPKHRPGRVPSSVRSVQIDTAISVTTFQGGSPRICTDNSAHELRSRASTIASPPKTTVYSVHTTNSLLLSSRRDPTPRHAPHTPHAAWS